MIAIQLIHPLNNKEYMSYINNYRGISPLSATYKILSQALLTRVKVQLNSWIGEYRVGFRKSRSCIEQILNPKSILVHRNLIASLYATTLVDFSKAYDSINRHSLFQTLNELRLDSKTINLVKATLFNTTSKVKFRRDLSKSLKIEQVLDKVYPQSE